MMRSFHKSDYLSLCRWYERHGIQAPEASSLSKFGYIVPEVAAGFLYRTDSDVCLIEGVITNPTACRRERLGAVKLIASGLTEAASALGFKRVFAMTQKRSLGRVGLAQGFSHLGGFEFYSKEIG